jgi:hypothetical protein
MWEPILRLFAVSTVQNQERLAEAQIAIIQSNSPAEFNDFLWGYSKQ